MVGPLDTVQKIDSDEGWLFRGGPAPPRLQAGRAVFQFVKFLAGGEYGRVYLYRAPNGAKLALKVANDTVDDRGRRIQSDECHDSSFYFADCAHIVEQRCLTPRAGVLVMEVEGVLTVYPHRYHCIVMEVLDTDLDSALKRRLGASAKKKIVDAVDHAFQCLVEQHKYYTDLKPANAMLNWAAASPDDLKEVSARDIRDVKLIDLGSICALGSRNGSPASYPPPNTWNAFHGTKVFAADFDRDSFGNVPCTEATAVWQVAVFVLAVYLGPGAIARFVYSEAPARASSAQAKGMFDGILAKLTRENFPNLWLGGLRKLFTNPFAPLKTKDLLAPKRERFPAAAWTPSLMDWSPSRKSPRRRSPRKSPSRKSPRRTSSPKKRATAKKRHKKLVRFVPKKKHTPPTPAHWRAFLALRTG